VKKLSTLLAVGVLAVAGCGDDDDSTTAAPMQTTPQAPVKDAKKPPPGTTIKVGESEFGDMLFDANEQAIYIFENDPKGESVCYEECAAAWPPVYTEGKPKGTEGVDMSLLGTVERRDGKLQVTYNGKPLYFYAHEEPGEVLCHDVFLNGGYWWAVGRNGNRRP
jgi:predicted lipoprotein with Yx(FWY)xxD motif